MKSSRTFRLDAIEGNVTVVVEFLFPADEFVIWSREIHIQTKEHGSTPLVWLQGGLTSSEFLRYHHWDRHTETIQSWIKTVESEARTAYRDRKTGHVISILYDGIQLSVTSSAANLRLYDTFTVGEVIQTHTRGSRAFRVAQFLPGKEVEVIGFKNKYMVCE